ncbi:MAG: phosphoribosylamine--glycine ligase [bacterium]
MNILVIGGGGREHALVWKITQSPLVDAVYCAPGNPGIGALAACVNLPPSNSQALLEFALEKQIDLTVVGPEQPLVDGIVDEFQAEGLAIFGPSRQAAQIEGSKAFTKHLLNKYHIPTAKYQVFDKFDQARETLKESDYPTVIKADGLAAGKGALICQTEEEASLALNQIMVEKAFGEAGDKVVIEEFMVGEEASILALTDGENIVYLPSAQDHKAIFDDDTGPNTGGMGAYAPAPVIDDAMFERIKKDIFEPVVKAMTAEGTPYRGVLYAGLMMTADGPKVVEFNCRFGDPETQVVLPLIEGDLVELMFRIAGGKKIQEPIKLASNKWALCVVLASGGYPERYEKGKRIWGLDKDFDDEVVIFHAGTKQAGHQIVTNGGRVLGVTVIGDDFSRVREKAYWAVGKITFDKVYYRKDIGVKARAYMDHS